MHQKTVDALEKLEKLIRYGEVGVSGFLPAERDICRQLNIGRGALQTVIDELTARGLVCRVPGKGVKILTRNEDAIWKKFLVIINGKSLNVTEYFELLRGVATAADEQGAEIVLFFYHNDFIDRRLNERLTDDNLNGIIFLEKFPPRIREAMKQFSLPYIVANYEEQDADVPAIRVDYRQIGRNAGRYLVGNGHKKVGFVGGSHENFIYREMLAGLKGALAEDDLTPDAELSLEIDSKLSLKERKQCVMDMLKKHSGKGAVFAGRDHIAQLIYECSKELKLNIPEDISIISNDNVSWPEAAKAGLTTFAQPAFETGQAAINALCKAMDTNAPIKTELLIGELIERSSVITN